MSGGKAETSWRCVQSFSPLRSGCVSLWESAFGAFTYEPFNFARGQRETKTSCCWSENAMLLFFLFSVNLLLHCQLLALATCWPQTDRQTESNVEVKWPACSQKAVFHSQKVPALQPQDCFCFPKAVAFLWEDFDVWSIEKVDFSPCSDCWILLMLPNGPVDKCRRKSKLWSLGWTSPYWDPNSSGKFPASPIFRKDGKPLSWIVVYESWNNNALWGKLCCVKVYPQFTS